jgi:hypothetical protein
MLSLFIRFRGVNCHVLERKSQVAKVKVEFSSTIDN